MLNFSVFGAGQGRGRKGIDLGPLRHNDLFLL